MRTGSKNELIRRPIARDGDGESIRIVRETRPKTDGTSEQSVGIDLTYAPVPPRKYVADIARVDQKNTYIRLMFGQEMIGSGALRSLIVLHMSTESIGRLLESCTDFLQSIRKHAERKQIPAYPLSTSFEEPAQTVALTSNIVAVAFSDGEAAIDFYMISPWGIRDLSIPSSTETQVDPVVRVQLPTSLLISVFDSLEALPNIRTSAGADA